MKPWFKRGALLLVSSALALGLAELALRLAPGRAPLVSGRIPLVPYLRLTLEHDLRGIPSPTEYSANGLGFRGPPPPADWDRALTILAVGGSTTQCIFLDDRHHWPILLQERLRRTQPGAWVNNAGIDGHTTRGHRALLEEVVLKLKPRYVLFLVGINDLGLSLDRATRLEGSPYDDVEWWRTSWKVRLMKHSRLAALAYKLKQRYLDKAVAMRGAHRNWVPEEVPPESLRPVTDLPQLEEFRANLAELVRLCQDRGIEPIFLTQPLAVTTNEPWMRVRAAVAWDAEALAVSAAEFARLMGLYNRATLEVASRLHVPAFDLAAAVPPVPENFYDLCHFTEAGAARVADSVAAFLETVLPRPLNPEP